MKRLALMLLLLASTSQAALLEYYVDPGVVGGLGDGTSWANAYSSLSACEAARSQDLTDNGGDTMIWWCKSSDGTADTTAVTIDGNVEDATHYLTIQGYDFPSDGVYDATKYRLYTNNTGLPALKVADQYTRIVHIQTVVDCSTNWGYGIVVKDQDAGGSAIYIEGCIANGQTITGEQGAYGIYVNDVDATVFVYNCVSDGFISASHPAAVDFKAFFAKATTNVSFFNCTAYGNNFGIHLYTGTATATNCISGNNTDDFSGTITIDYCATDDGDGDHAVAPSGGDWANEFVNAAAGNFALKATGNCVDAGTDNPGSGIYLDDILGETRVSPWDIGAFEYISGEKVLLMIE